MYIVFIDTNEYDRCGHNFNSTPFKKLRKLSNKGEISLISTNVVIGEVKQHIIEDVKNFFNMQRELATNARVVRNLDEFEHMIAKIDENELERMSLQSFDKFLIETNCNILSSKEIDNDRLLNDYFNKKFPFENNFKKGDEFKDAFIVYALKKFVDDNNVEVIIISQDKGLVSAFEGNPSFQIYHKTDDFLAYITKIEDIPKNNIQKIKEYINSSALLFDRAAAATIDVGVWTQESVDDVSINNVKIQSISVLYIDGMENDIITVNLEISAEIYVSFDVIDQDNSYWDKEKSEYLFYETHKIQVSKCVDLNSTLKLYVQTNEDKEIEEISDYESIVLNGYEHGIELDFNFYIDDYTILNSSLNNSEGYLEGAYNICPDCSCSIYNHNDAGNGFCTNCFHKHF